MLWEGNERTIIETCMDKLKKEEMRRVRAAYALPLVKEIGAEERHELVQLLLKGEREFNLEGEAYLQWSQHYLAEWELVCGTAGEASHGGAAGRRQRARQRVKRKAAKGK